MTHLTYPVLAAEECAREVLNKVCRDSVADPFSVASALGIGTSAIDLPRDQSGRLAVHPSGTRIYVNTHDLLSRQRFACAHAIGHYLDRAETRPTIIDYRSTLAGIGVDDTETFANQFAAALLMPASAVARLMKNSVPISQMADYFTTTRRALELRLANLHLA
jgi:Zn-dependent peptidase ImmA (M78 family)